MSKPFFSVVIPTYNRLGYIQATIKSVQNQSFQNWECIVVDDGSTDGTKDIISDIIEKDKRIKYLYQTNAERSVARNNGISKSIGEYICFLDSDDLYKVNHLEVLKKEIGERQNPCALFFVNSSSLIGEQLTSIDTVTYDRATDYFIKASIIPARVCIHRDILKSYLFDPRIVIVEDAVLWTQISLNFAVFHIEKETITYRSHDDNSVNFKNNCFLPRLRGLQLLYQDKEIREKIARTNRNASLSNCYYGIAKFHFFKRNFFRMLANILFSLWTDSKCKQNKAKIYMIYDYIR